MLREHTQIFKALSDRNRLRIVMMLQAKPMCVCEITEVLQLAFSTVSKHLSILRDAGIIEDLKNGKWVEYKINPQPENGIVRMLLKEFKKSLISDKAVSSDREKAFSTSRQDIMK